MVDSIVLGLIAVSAVFGFIRGIVSQLMALVGIVAAYLFAPPLGTQLGSFVQAELGTSRFMAEKASIFLVGIGIYIAARIFGYLLSHAFVNRVKPLWKLNRLGGAVLGAAKTTAVIAIVFFFLALVPRKMVEARAPGILKSRTYELAVKYNPMGEQGTLESMRNVRATLTHPDQKRKLMKDPRLKKVLGRYGLESALQDPRFLKSVEEGDFEKLRDNQQVEKLMQDEELAKLLASMGQN